MVMMVNIQMKLKRFMKEIKEGAILNDRKKYFNNFVKVFLIGISFLCFASCGEQKKLNAQTEFAFGTVCTVNLFDDGTEELYREIFTLVNSIEKKFSVNISNSEISLINQNAAKNKVEVSEDVYSLIEFSKEMSLLTENAFNPALGSLIKLWAIGTDRQCVPAKDEIEELIKYCNPQKIVLEKTDEKYFVYLTDEKTQIDLGGIVKGYATDKIVELLKAKNVKRAIIDLGGNIYVFGKKSETAGEENWKVGIKNPIDQSAEPIKIVSVNSTSVVTSGNYERFFIQDGKRYHHIIDSKTGMPVENGLASVTIISEKSVVCDAFSTASFAGGVELAEKLVKMEKIGKIRIIFITFDGKIREI